MKCYLPFVEERSSSSLDPSPAQDPPKHQIVFELLLGVSSIERVLGRRRLLPLSCLRPRQSILRGLIHVGIGVNLKEVSRFGGAWELSYLFFSN
jgi:hypothetical protein